MIKLGAEAYTVISFGCFFIVMLIFLVIQNKIIQTTYDRTRLKHPDYDQQDDETKRKLFRENTVLLDKVIVVAITVLAVFIFMHFLNYLSGQQ